jgi:hypothetical protein
MSTYLRNPGTIVELDDTSITLRAEDGTLRRATRGAGFHCWLVVPGLKIGGRFTDAPEAGDVVSFVTSDSIETVVEPPVFDLLPRDDELLAMLGQDTPATEPRRLSSRQSNKSLHPPQSPVACIVRPVAFAVASQSQERRPHTATRCVTH